MQAASRNERLELTVRAAIEDYALSADQPIAAVVKWLATRRTVEIAADLIGLDAGDGVHVNRSTVFALARVLKGCGYEGLKLFEGADDDGDG